MTELTCVRACGLFSGIPSSTAADVSQRLIKVVEILISLESSEAEGGRREGRKGEREDPLSNCVCELRASLSFHVGFSPPPSSSFSRMFVRPSFRPSLFPLSAANECDHTKLIGRLTDRLHSFSSFYFIRLHFIFLLCLRFRRPPRRTRSVFPSPSRTPDRKGSKSSFCSNFIGKKPSKLPRETRCTFSSWTGEITDKNLKFSVNFLLLVPLLLAN